MRNAIDRNRGCRRADIRRAGFTLIEILITLGVVGILATALTAGLLGTTRNERLRAAARKVAGLSDFVRSMAVAGRRAAYLDLDFDHDRIRFRMEPKRDEHGRCVDPDDPGRHMTQAEVAEWKEAFDWWLLPHGVHLRRLWKNSKKRDSFTTGLVHIEYRPTGTLHSWILWLETETEAGLGKTPCLSVVVNGLSGQSEILPGKKEFPTADKFHFKDVLRNAPGAESP